MEADLEKVLQDVPTNRIPPQLRYFLDLFWGKVEHVDAPPESRVLLERLMTAQMLCLVTSPETNVMAARLQAVAYRLGYRSGAEWLFKTSLASLIGGPFSGPYYEYTKNLVELAGLAVPAIPQEMLGNRAEKRLQSHPAARLEQALRCLWRQPGSGTDADSSFWVGRSNLEMRLANFRTVRNIIQAAARRRDSAVRRPSMIDLGNALSGLICKALSLRPEIYWKCGLSLKYAQTPESNWVWGSSPWLHVQDSLRSETLTEPDCFYLAWKLFLDSWAETFKWDSKMRVSNFTPEFEQSISRCSHPALKIGLAIWQLSYGKGTETAFVELSYDGACRRMFHECGWIADRKSKGAEA